MIENISDDVQDGAFYFLLTDKKFLQICRTKLSPILFKSPIQQKICRIIFDFWDKYQNIVDSNVDEIIVSAFKEDEQNLVIQYLTKIFSAKYVKEYIYDKIDLFIQKREWERVLIDSVELLDKDDLGSIENKVQKIIRNKFNYSDIKNVLKEDLKEFYDDSNKGEICCLSGIKALDAIIGGLRYRELTIIVAPLNVGKSWMFTFLGSKALLHGKTVLHITTEMSRHKVKERYFQRFAGVTDKPSEELEIWCGNQRIKHKPDHIGNATKVKKSLETMHSFGGKLFVIEFPDKTLTIPKMESLLNNMELEQGKYPDLILVDGLQGLKYSTNSRDDWKDLENLSHELRRIAMEKNISIVASTHSGRTSIGNKIVQAKDVRGSIDILNIADLGISINQTNEEYLLGQARLFIMRARSSKKWGQIRVYQNYDLGHFCVFSELVE